MATLSVSAPSHSRASCPGVEATETAASLYLGVSECGAGGDRCQGGSQRYSLPSIVIKSYVLVCQVSSASRCHERGEQWGLCDHHLDPHTRTIHQKLVRKPSRDRKHLSEMHNLFNPCIMCVCLVCNATYPVNKKLKIEPKLFFFLELIRET